jgi:hypothetical protein
VTGEGSSVGKDYVIVDFTIVRHMAVRHKKIVITDDRFAL